VGQDPVRAACGVAAVEPQRSGAASAGLLCNGLCLRRKGERGNDNAFKAAR
jgi:hypothetical protein